MPKNADSIISAGVVITAAGTGERFGNGLKKVYQPLGKTTVLAKSLNAFIRSRSVNYYIIVHPAGEEEQVWRALGSLTDTPPELILVAGGPTRAASAANGLKALAEGAEPPKIVLIHDGARPWVSQNLIEKVCQSTAVNKVCAPAVTLNDAIKVVDRQGKICGHPDRGQYRRIQTPQGYILKEILAAHCLAAQINLKTYDDTEIYEKYSQKPALTIPGERANRKITYPEDLES